MKLSKYLPTIITQLVGFGLVAGSFAVHKEVAATILACTAAILFAIAMVLFELASWRRM